MCGIAGIVTRSDEDARTCGAALTLMRDRLAHRGPDGTGHWLDARVALGHRRLAVRGLGDAGSQPMELTVEGRRHVLIYNGELYNDRELRRALAREGVCFRGDCDTETVLAALACWGEGALPRLRGMFALAWYDEAGRTLTLARDPLGIKPLYWMRRGPSGRLLFASEIPGLLAHPGFRPEPDHAMVSAYLTTIRTVLGTRTMFQGIEAVSPGGLVRVSVEESEPRAVCETWFREPRQADPVADTEAGARVREVMAESVERHMLADVPTCALLSGGLDSTITTILARRDVIDLRTYCAGARGQEGDDFAFAAGVARTLQTHHREAVVDRARFGEQWRWMVERQGVPLSTPNEVAIHEVAAALRADGCVVTISGEGADELFAGYQGPLDAAWEATEAGIGDGGEFQLVSNAWVRPDAKGELCTPAWLAAIEEDAWLRSHYRERFESCVEGAGAGVRAHMLMMRHINLTGLLQRLDTATMLASVEGRTPFADVEVAALSGRLSLRSMYASPEESPRAAVRTKLVLREAFADVVPRDVLLRPKASFPLPFQGWMEDVGDALRGSDLLRTMLRREVIEQVADRPADAWWLAWPLANLAIWSRVLW